MTAVLAPEGDAAHHCVYCAVPTAFNSSIGLGVHLRRRHGISGKAHDPGRRAINVRDVTCPSCGIAVAGQQGLRTHHARMHITRDASRSTPVAVASSTNERSTKKPSNLTPGDQEYVRRRMVWTALQLAEELHLPQPDVVAAYMLALAMDLQPVGVAALASVEKDLAYGDGGNILRASRPRLSRNVGCRLRS